MGDIGHRSRGRAVGPEHRTAFEQCQIVLRTRGVASDRGEQPRQQGGSHEWLGIGQRVGQLHQCAARIVRAANAAGLDDDTKLENAYSSLAKVGVLRKISQGDISEGVSNYALGEIIPYRTKDLTNMAQALHCSTDYLLGLTDQLRSAAAEPG